jgi:hypothetical protein
MDGYSDAELSDMLKYIKYLSNRQSKLNNELASIVKEMEGLPRIPLDIDNWIDSVRESENDFKLADFKKLFKINKRYNQIIEEKEENTRSIRIMAIDNLLGKIAEILKDE